MSKSFDLSWRTIAQVIFVAVFSAGLAACGGGNSTVASDPADGGATDSGSGTGGTGGTDGGTGGTGGGTGGTGGGTGGTGGGTGGTGGGTGGTGGGTGGTGGGTGGTGGGTGGTGGGTGGTGGGTGGTGGGTGGTGGGTGGTGGGTGGTGNLSITVLDNTPAGNPMPGIPVSVYADDDQTITQTIVTGADGVANFGAVAGGSVSTKAANGVSVSLVFGAIGSDIEVVHGVDLERQSYLVIDPRSSGSSSCQPTGSVSGTVTGIPGTGFSASLFPLFTGFNITMPTSGFPVTQVVNGQASFSNVVVCASDQQSNGLVSMLVVIVDSAAQIVGYAYLPDRAVSNNMQFNVAAQTNLPVINWTANGPGNDLIALLGIYQGRLIPTVSSLAQKAASGTMPTIPLAPIDTWVAQATASTTGANESSCSWWKPFASIPNPLVIDRQDFGNSSFVYDGATRSIAAGLSTQVSADAQFYDLELQSTNDVDMFIIAPANLTGVKIPNLPPPFDVLNTAPVKTQSSRANVVSTELNGFDALIRSVVVNSRVLLGTVYGGITQQTGVVENCSFPLSGGT